MDLFAGGSPQSGWRLLFFLGPAFVVSPGLIQKAFGARDERAVTTGIALNGLALLAFAALPTAIGMAARVMHPDINKDLAFATMASELTPVFGAFALAAVFSAEASAADAVLFMLATSGSRDVYRRLRPSASDSDLLRAARISAVVGAGLGLGLAMMHKSVIDAIGTFYAVMVVTLVRAAVGGSLYSLPHATPGAGVARRSAGPRGSAPRYRRRRLWCADASAFRRPRERCRFRHYPATERLNFYILNKKTRVLRFELM